MENFECPACHQLLRLVSSELAPLSPASDSVAPVVAPNPLRGGGEPRQPSPVDDGNLTGAVLRQRGLGDLLLKWFEEGGAWAGWESPAVIHERFVEWRDVYVGYRVADGLTKNTLSKALVAIGGEWQKVRTGRVYSVPVGFAPGPDPAFREVAVGVPRPPEGPAPWQPRDLSPLQSLPPAAADSELLEAAGAAAATASHLIVDDCGYVEYLDDLEGCRAWLMGYDGERVLRIVRAADNKAPAAAAADDKAPAAAAADDKAPGVEDLVDWEGSARGVARLESLPPAVPDGDVLAAAEAADDKALGVEPLPADTWNDVLASYEEPAATSAADDEAPAVSVPAGKFPYEAVRPVGDAFTRPLVGEEWETDIPAATVLALARVRAAAAHVPDEYLDDAEWG